MTTPASSTPAPSPQPEPSAAPFEPDPVPDIKPDPMLSQVIERADPHRLLSLPVLTKGERVTEGDTSLG
jgi:hypothetical protein